MFVNSCLGFCLAQRAVGQQPFAQGAHGAGDKDRPAGDLAHIADQLDGAKVQLAYLVGQAEGGQAHAIGAKGVGLDHIGAGGGVGLMDFGHPPRAGKDQLLQALLAAGAFGVQHGAHGAVGEQGPFGQAL